MRREPEFDKPFEPPDEVGRRQVLKAMGASFGLAGLAACSEQPDTHAIPYVHTPEFTIPDKARHYATAVVTLGGYGQPVLGETHVGRPTKLEGMPGHPAAMGGADAFTQAAMAGLYDPDRSKGPLYLGKPCDWTAFDAAMIANARQLTVKDGDGFWLLTGQHTSPTFARQVAALKQRWPKARWAVWEPVGDDKRLAAAKLVFDRPLQLIPQLDQADVVVSLDDDLLGPGPAQTRNGKLWAKRRRAFQAGGGSAHLLFVAEPTPSLTGAVASDRLACDNARTAALAKALLAAFGLDTAPMLTPREAQWVDAAAAALKQAGAAGLVTAGSEQLPEVQAAAVSLTHYLGGLGRTLTLAEPVTVQGYEPLEALRSALQQGQVDTLAILDSNPGYTAATLPLAKARLMIHAGLHADETALHAHWHTPIEHPLETWSDARTVDGTAGLIQPLVRPFYAVRSPHVLLEDVQGNAGSNAHSLVSDTWRQDWGDDFDGKWLQALQRGFIDGSQAQGVDATPKAVGLNVPDANDAPQLIVRPDPCIWDGRFSNNPYLQELPKPLTKVTWDNVLLVSPGLARQLDLKPGDEVRITVNGHALTAPAWIMPGQARHTVVAFLGYGRHLPGHTGDGHGYNAYPLLGGAGVSFAKTGKKIKLAVTQPQQKVEGPDPIPVLGRAEAAQPAKPKAKTLSFYPDVPATSPSWGMVIDTDVCIGCNACVSACDIENNVVTVGKDQTAMGREMHWLRVDHYVAGEDDDAHIAFQPIPCMQCEQAPCELGCPVHAAVHGADGLNLQVYNRCIGTRTCSSYCPYKVRHFNWYDWTHLDPPERRAQRNPNVTVRTRGVMEKCTYCIQRISNARIQAKIENRPIRDGEIRTACQQTCPTEAITFGDITDPSTAVSKLKAQGRNYVLLEEMNTRPRTSYLKRLKPDGEA